MYADGDIPEELKNDKEAWGQYIYHNFEERFGRQALTFLYCKFNHVCERFQVKALQERCIGSNYTKSVTRLATQGLLLLCPNAFQSMTNV